MNLFNIGVIVPRREETLPDQALSKIKLFDERSNVIQIRAAMSRGEGITYWFADSLDLFHTLISEVENFRYKNANEYYSPSLELASMERCSFNEDTISN